MLIGYARDCLFARAFGLKLESKSERVQANTSHAIVEQASSERRARLPGEGLIC